MASKDVTVCQLCSLTCGRNPVRQSFDGIDLTFCCAGCVNVYAILLESGVLQSGVDVRDTELFRLSLDLGLIANPAEEEGESGVERTANAVPPQTETRDSLLQITGMWCTACSWLIEHALCKEKGVKSADVYFASDLLKVSYYPQYLPPGRIDRIVTGLGYEVSEYEGDTEKSDAERKDLLLRLGVAVFFWINVMMLNVGIYARYIQEIPAAAERYLPFLLMLLTAPAVFYSSQPILRLAWKGIRKGAIRMETLLALGILAAFGYSVQQTFTGGEHVYFDTTCALVALVLIGKWAERNGKAKTSKGITLMYRMMPRKARIMVDGRERFAALEALHPGDRFLVKAGERIPADGLVLQGESHVDESLISGESAPIEKGPGDRVVGGSVSSGGLLEVEATRVGTDSTLGHILKSVEAALSSRSAIERTVDRISRIFVPGVVLVAVVTFLVVWMFSGEGLGLALMRGITVLVIACPCALGIATPLAVTAAVGAASGEGILVRDSRVLETIQKVDLAAFDKTGTITMGSFELLRCEKEHLATLASLEAFSEHPLGQAVIRWAHDSNLSWAPATSVRIEKGMGITGEVKGKRVFIGNRSLVERETGLDFPASAEERQWEVKGYTVSFYGWDGSTKGILVFGDQVRSEASSVVEELKDRGVRVMIVSGDSHATTQWVSQQVGADGFLGGAQPLEKAQFVSEARSQGQTTAMVGDGVNDAPALAAADLGISVGSGADIAMKAAGIVLMSNDLGKITQMIDLARKTLRIIRQNLFWAFLYNTVGISLAIAGLLTPILAAAAMVVSSLSVIGNSLRLCR